MERIDSPHVASEQSESIRTAKDKIKDKVFQIGGVSLGGMAVANTAYMRLSEHGHQISAVSIASAIAAGVAALLLRKEK